MRKILIIVSIIGLLLTVVPPVLVFIQEISMEAHKQIMIVGMLMWFGTAPFWMKEQEL